MDTILYGNFPNFNSLEVQQPDLMSRTWYSCKGIAFTQQRTNADNIKAVFDSVTGNIKSIVIIERL